jgi:hypothetical protein
MAIRTRTCAAIFLAATIAAVCAGKGEANYSLSDARQLANLRPTAPPWTWRPEDQKSADSSASVRGDPLLARFRRETKELVDLGEAGGEWVDADKLAHIDVAVYKTSADAHKAFAPFNALSLGWARRSRHVVGQSSVEGLGDEAWLLRVADDGEQVTYHWRRDNVLVEAHMHCFGACPAGLLSAARAWAERIDAAARRLA